MCIPPLSHLNHTLASQQINELEVELDRTRTSLDTHKVQASTHAQALKAATAEIASHLATIETLKVDQSSISSRMTHHFSTNRISAHHRPSSVSRTARQWLCFRRTTQPHRRWRKCMHPLPSCSEKCSAHRTSPRPRPRSILIGCAVLCEIGCADM